MTSINDPRIIIEFIQVGAYVKVSAVDPVSLVEVSIVGPVIAKSPILSPLLLLTLPELSHPLT